MNSVDLLLESISRPAQAAHQLSDTLISEQLNAHPADHDNSIAWLLWHTGREIDVQIENLGGKETWKAKGFNERFNLGEIGDSLGYGHSSEEARSIVVPDLSLLLEYIDATVAAFKDYVRNLSDDDLDEVIDQSWEPAVTRGVRLISIIDDAAQHVGQAAYVESLVKN